MPHPAIDLARISCYILFSVDSLIRETIFLSNVAANFMLALDCFVRYTEIIRYFNITILSYELVTLLQDSCKYIVDNLFIKRV